MKRTIPKLLTLVYIFETVKNTLLHGSAFWKNDIIDAMILGSMTPNDHLITCDKKMMGIWSDTKKVISNMQIA